MQIPHIPPLNAEQHAAHLALTQHIANIIAAQGGQIPFSDFMQQVLYAPQYGYYTGGAHKIGAAGDFITAPELSPLFAQTLATQLVEILPNTAGNVYEFGAGTGALAAQLLPILSSSGCLKNYYIIELSPELSQRQQKHIQHHAPKNAHQVAWLNTLPEAFDGVIIGNEVLDAMPVERVRHAENGFERAYVAHENGQFLWQYQPLVAPDLLALAREYFPENTLYTSELHPTQHAFIQTLAQKLTCGSMIFIDYGFDSKQYYHPQRTDGTLIAHHRHHSIHDPFFRVGLCDLTAHVHFSDIAAAAHQAGLDLIGYTSQAHFLFNLGILDMLAAQYPYENRVAYTQAAHAVQQLTAEHEMGELFKVIAFGKNIDVDWRGFCRGDMCHKL